MPTYTLDQLRKDVAAKYEPLTIDLGEAGKLDLVQPMRLSKKERAELMAKQAVFNDLQDEVEAANDADRVKAAEDAEDKSLEAMHDIFRIVSQNSPQVKKFIEAVGDDLAVLMEVFSHYQEKAELGEA